MAPAKPIYSLRSSKQSTSSKTTRSKSILNTVVKPVSSSHAAKQSTSSRTTRSKSVLSLVAAKSISSLSVSTQTAQSDAYSDSDSDPDSDPGSDSDSATYPDFSRINAGTTSAQTLDKLVLSRNIAGFTAGLQDRVERLRGHPDYMGSQQHAIHQDTAVSWFLDTIDIYIDPVVQLAIDAEHPPDQSVFLNLPSAYDIDKAVLKMSGAVYAMCLLNEQNDFRLYIGSACGINEGAWARIRGYRIYHSLPKFVGAALKNGFKIVHIGLLCLFPKTLSSDLFHKFRAWILTIEADLTFLFWAVYQSAKHEDKSVHSMSPLCPWDMNEILYSGLCCSNPLKENVVKLDQWNTLDDLVQYNITREEKRLEIQRRHLSNRYLIRKEATTLTRKVKAEGMSIEDFDDETRNKYEEGQKLLDKHSKDDRRRHVRQQDALRALKKFEDEDVLVDIQDLDDDVRSTLELGEKVRETNEKRRIHANTKAAEGRRCVAVLKQVEDGELSESDEVVRKDCEAGRKHRIWQKEKSEYNKGWQARKKAKEAAKKD